MTAAVLALSIPAMTAAQGSYDPYGRPDYRRDRDYDPYHRDDPYYRNGRYDGRYLRDTIRDLDRLSAQFERDLDRALDHSRENGSRHEDHLNADTKEFRRAVRDLRSSFNDGRDLYRSRSQAEAVLDTAEHVERVVQHHFYDNRLASEWSQIREDLRVIADAYNLGYSGGYYGNNDIYRNRRNDDIYRDRRYPTNNVPWWRRVPWP